MVGADCPTHPSIIAILPDLLCRLALFPVSSGPAWSREVLAGRGISVTYETVRQWASSGAFADPDPPARASSSQMAWMVVVSIAGELTGCGAQSSRMASF
jgi:hypothetical protein